MEENRPLRGRIGWQRVVAVMATTLIGVAFLASAGGKAAGAEAFGWTIYDWGLRNESAAMAGAWALIGLEALLGAAVLLRVGLRGWSLMGVTTLLLLFSGYLVLVLVREGNGGDCGCFGEWLEMSPALALGKNAILLLLCIPARRAVRCVKSGLRVAARAGVLPLALSSVLVPYLISTRPKPPRRLDFTPLYSSTTIPAAPADLAQGQRVVFFFSAGCGHCRAAGAQLGAWQASRPDLPVYYALLADSAGAADFVAETKTSAIPHSRIEDTKAFRKMAGRYVPAIYFLRDGVVQREVSYRRLTRQAIDTWVGSTPAMVR